MDELYKKAMQLREFKKLHRYYRRKNQEKGGEQRKVIRKAKGWCRQAERIDAEEYYRGEIVKICKKIKKEKAYR